MLEKDPSHRIHPSDIYQQLSSIIHGHTMFIEKGSLVTHHDHGHVDGFCILKKIDYDEKTQKNLPHSDKNVNLTKNIKENPIKKGKTTKSNKRL